MEGRHNATEYAPQMPRAAYHQRRERDIEWERGKTEGDALAPDDRG